MYIDIGFSKKFNLIRDIERYAVLHNHNTNKELQAVYSTFLFRITKRCLNINRDITALVDSNLQDIQVK